jgi:hypothetical protein
MGLGVGCLYACAPFTLVASILLFVMSVMLRDGNWTFEVLARKNEWDRSAKSRTCRNGGIIYLCISIVLWCLVLTDSFVIQLEKVPGFVATLWRQRRLPSWRELRRNHRKSSTHKERAQQPAADVVVTTLSTSPPAQLPQLHGAAATSPAQSSAGTHTGSPFVTTPSAVLVAAPEASTETALSSSPLTSHVYGGLLGPTVPPAVRPGRGAVSPSENTSATPSVVEADHLLS